MLNYLTDYRRKDNNIKMTQLLDVEFKEVDDLLKTIEEWRDVDKAEGEVLDQLGLEVGQLRKNTTDEVFRFLIKAKILSNNSRGDVYSIVSVISAVLELDAGEFEISESYLEDIENVGMIDIKKIPITTMLETGLTRDEFILLVKSTLAGGIGINTLELEGTFDFSDKLVTDIETGFADVEMTTGGILGELYLGGDK